MPSPLPSPQPRAFRVPSSVAISVPVPHTTWSHPHTTSPCSPPVPSPPSRKLAAATSQCPMEAQHSGGKAGGRVASASVREVAVLGAVSTAGVLLSLDSPGLSRRLDSGLDSIHPLRSR
ncbi:hypothetical protein PVAP13_6NG179300 [Panicum virgatum]|uniref:Uncharacterized protein n=1 Tax=Panicum virgatum TaxID=38727 RepID=A0A8T0QZY5_PANVG|nr:hypothetical protein PVAP13_6NG179300 [Panicum virgatum]